MPEASESQQEKIEKEISENIYDFWESDAGESLSNDLHYNQ